MTRSQLPSTISTPQDLALLILDVKKYAKWYLQHYNAQQANVIYSEKQPDISIIAKELIISWDKQKTLTPESLDAHITNLEKTGRSAPVVTITLASPASQTVRQTIASWCRENLHPEVLVSFEFNSSLLGGMTLRTGSKFYDWSFYNKLTNRKKLFSEVLG